MPGGLPPHSGGVLGRDSDADSGITTTCFLLETHPQPFSKHCALGAWQLFGQVGPRLISWRAGLGDPSCRVHLYSSSPCSACMDAVPTFWIHSAPPSSAYRVPREQFTLAFSLGNWSY